MTRLLIIDHNASRRSGRSLYTSIHRTGIAEVAIVAPRVWSEFGMTWELEMGQDEPLVHPLDIVFGGRHHRVVYRGLAPVLRTFNPDIVLCNAEPENFLAFQIVRLRKTLRANFRIVLITWRNVDYRKTGYPYRFSSVHRWIERQVLQSVDSIISHTSRAKPLYEEYDFQHVTPIPPAVDCSLFTPAGSSGNANRPNVTIGYAGRFTELKGGDLLLNALPSLPKECEVLMIGSGEQEERWKSLARDLGVSERVRWKGAVPHELMPSLLRTLDILVLPSRTGRYWKEQFGRILIEAMACGVVLVGSTSGEIPAVIQDAGQTFPEGDSQKLSDMLRSLTANASQRADLSQRGLDRARSTFSIDAVLPLYRSLFDRLEGRTG